MKDKDFTYKEAAKKLKIKPYKLRQIIARSDFAKFRIQTYTYIRKKAMYRRTNGIIINKYFLAEFEKYMKGKKWQHAT